MCRLFSAVSVSMVVLAVLAAPMAAQQLPLTYSKLSIDGTPIPDVNKPVPGPTDNSCWLASAANILGAAGYGISGSAQLNAQSIYSQLRAAYGTAAGGAPDQAISFWLANYGRNPSAAEYDPTNAYTDITAEYRQLNQTDYDFLRSELYRCQYVGVQFESPSHAVTLVGWDHTLTPTQSIWHDSDVNTTSPGDDRYDNVFGGTPAQWNLSIPGTGTYLSNANGYVTFCPGLDKPDEAMQNYDVAWHPSPQGPTYREAGAMAGAYAPPVGWLDDPSNPFQTQGGDTFYRFGINNQEDPLLKKEIHLLVDFYGRDSSYAGEDIRLRYFDAQGQEVILTPTVAPVLSADEGQVLFTWELDYQPAYEEILFPSHMDYNMLEGKVAWWDVATVCTPEPGSITVLALAAVAVLRRRRRR